MVVIILCFHQQRNSRSAVWTIFVRQFGPFPFGSLDQQHVQQKDHVLQLPMALDLSGCATGSPVRYWKAAFVYDQPAP